MVPIPGPVAVTPLAGTAILTAHVPPTRLQMLWPDDEGTNATVRMIAAMRRRLVAAITAPDAP